MAAPVLVENSRVTCWFADYAVATPARPSDMATLTSELDQLLGAELAGAQDAMDATAEEILLAALARSVGRTMGDGVLAVDLAGSTYSAGALRSRVGLRCDSRRDLSGSELLAVAQQSLNAREHVECPRADVQFCYREATSASAEDCGHALSVYIRRDPDAAVAVHVDWRYDTRSFDWNTIEELTEQFPLALIEVTSG